MNYDNERKNKLERNKDYYEKAIKDAEDRLKRGETKMPNGENVGGLLSMFKWIFGRTSDELDDRRKVDD